MKKVDVHAALAHLRCAIQELTYDEAVRIDAVTGKEMPCPLHAKSIGEDLQRLDRQLSSAGQTSLLGHIGSSITNALNELELAHKALGSDTADL